MVSAEAACRGTRRQHGVVCLVLGLPGRLPRGAVRLDAQTGASAVPPQVIAMMADGGVRAPRTISSRGGRFFAS